MNHAVYTISDMYIDNINTQVSTILWISYVILNLYYLYYLKHIKCDCYNLNYRTYIIILSVLSIVILFFINRNFEKNILIVYLLCLLLCDLLLTYNIRKLVVNVQKNKCYCAYTHNNFIDIHTIVKYMNLINIASILIGIIMVIYLFITNPKVSPI